MLENRLQDLPIGIQTFEELRNNNFLYVDKTKEVYELARIKTPYFLSRPRRFGKSMLCSTFKALFEGKKELFEGTWIATSDWQWQTHPVIHLDLSKMTYETPEELKEALASRLAEIGKMYNLTLDQKLPGAMLTTLIEQLAAQGPKPVCLIDEYDYPIITNLNDPTRLDAYREVMQNFYKPLKPCGEFLRFLFITGVSQFAKVSIFSALNHLRILSDLASSATICGYTQAELEQSFAPWITRAANHNNFQKHDLLAKIKKWYNGYCFADPQKAPHRVYNPFSIVNFFGDENAEFKDYWFASGTPTFVMQYFDNKSFLVSNFEHVKTDSSTISSLVPEHLEIVTLLYQAGYLTIKSGTSTASGVKYVLGFPNFEVKNACGLQLLKLIAKKNITALSDAADELHTLFVHDTVTDQSLMKVFKKICANIPIDMKLSSEENFQFLFWAVLQITGLDAKVENPSAKGYMDIMVPTSKRIFVIELKIVGSAESALDQIDERRYDEKFLIDGLPVTRIGAVFSEKERTMTKCKVLENTPV